jgi:hypothetical protein
LPLSTPFTGAIPCVSASSAPARPTAGFDHGSLVEHDPEQCEPIFRARNSVEIGFRDDPPEPDGGLEGIAATLATPSVPDMATRNQNRGLRRQEQVTATRTARPFEVAAEFERQWTWDLESHGASPQFMPIGFSLVLAVCGVDATLR